MKTSANASNAAHDSFVLVKTYENEFSQIGITLLTRALACAGLMAVMAGSIAILVDR